MARLGPVLRDQAEAARHLRLAPQLRLLAALSAAAARRDPNQREERHGGAEQRTGHHVCGVVLVVRHPGDGHQCAVGQQPRLHTHLVLQGHGAVLRHPAAGQHPGHGQHTVDTHLQHAEGERVAPGQPGGQQVEVARRPDHPVPGEARVPGQEAQPGLVHAVLALPRLGEQLGVAGAAEGGDVVWRAPVPARLRVKLQGRGCVTCHSAVGVL